MEKEILKWYVTPEMEVIETEAESQLLSSSTNPFDDSTGDTEEIE